MERSEERQSEIERRRRKKNLPKPTENQIMVTYFTLFTLIIIVS